MSNTNDEILEILNKKLKQQGINNSKKDLEDLDVDELLKIMSEYGEKKKENDIDTILSNNRQEHANNYYNEQNGGYKIYSEKIKEENLTRQREYDNQKKIKEIEERRELKKQQLKAKRDKQRKIKGFARIGLAIAVIVTVGSEIHNAIEDARLKNRETVIREELNENLDEEFRDSEIIKVGEYTAEITEKDKIEKGNKIIKNDGLLVSTNDVKLTNESKKLEFNQIDYCEFKKYYMELKMYESKHGNKNVSEYVDVGKYVAIINKINELKSNGKIDIEKINIEQEMLNYMNDNKLLHASKCFLGKQIRDAIYYGDYDVEWKEELKDVSRVNVYTVDGTKDFPGAKLKVCGPNDEKIEFGFDGGKSCRRKKLPVNILSTVENLNELSNYSRDHKLDYDYMFGSNEKHVFKLGEKMVDSMAKTLDKAYILNKDGDLVEISKEKLNERKMKKDGIELER